MQNRGVYMFRLDENRVVDATICGGLARYINHSCNPNCITEKVEVDRECRIIIFSKRRIARAEEVNNFRFVFLERYQGELLLINNFFAVILRLPIRHRGR